MNTLDVAAVTPAVAAPVPIPLDAPSKPGRFHTFVSWTLGPLYIVAGIGIFMAVHRYMALSPFMTYIVMNAIVIVMTQVLELVFPYEKSWRKPDDQFFNELASTFLSATLGHKIGKTLAFAGFGWFLTWSRESGGGAAPWWPTSLPFAVQVMLAFVIWEFGLYWNHRFMHGAAWRFHSLHHKLRRLSWINSGYGHPMNFVLTSLFSYTALSFSGAPVDVLIFSGYFSLVINFLSHANIDVKMGWLNWVLNTPELHRWHHVNEPESAGRNFGTQLIIWDLIFGTYYLPKDKLPSRNLGDDTPAPSSYAAQWLAPFRWAQSMSWTPTIPARRMSFLPAREPSRDTSRE